VLRVGQLVKQTSGIQYKLKLKGGFQENAVEVEKKGQNTLPYITLHYSTLQNEQVTPAPTLTMERPYEKLYV